MITDQLFDLVDIGIVILEKDTKVHKWNRWMELHSQIPADQIVGSPLFDFFPNLNNPGFLRSLKYVLSFGNFYFFSQKLHEYLFPFKPVTSLASDIQRMQQSCNMGPLMEDGVPRYAYITVQDVTEVTIYEKALLEMNIKDCLTNIFNRRYLEDRLKEEFGRYKRTGHPFSLIMFDIDFFKHVNDTYGHQCGDVVIKSISRSVASIIRSTDILARYGGEEFACLLPETGISGAARVAEQFRRIVEDQVFDFQENQVKVTISLGVAELGSDTESPIALLEKADAALYEAKRTGRNKTVAVG